MTTCKTNWKSDYESKSLTSQILTDLSKKVLIRKSLRQVTIWIVLVRKSGKICFFWPFINKHETIAKNNKKSARVEKIDDLTAKQKPPYTKNSRCIDKKASPFVTIYPAET